MDGFDAPMEPPPKVNGDALIHLAIRMGAIEQALRGQVTHEKLITILNEQNRDVRTTIRDSEGRLTTIIEANNQLTEKRQTDAHSAQGRRTDELFNSLDMMLDAKVGGAVERAFKARDEAEAKVRTEIDNKAKDAARGIRIIASTMPPLLGGLAVAAGFIGWMWMTGKLG